MRSQARRFRGIAPARRWLVVIAVLLWAHHRLSHVATAADADRLVQRCGGIPIDASLRGSWNGTRRALTYGRHLYKDVKPIVDVLALLEQPVTEHTREELARLLFEPAPPPPRPQR